MAVWLTLLCVTSQADDTVSVHIKGVDGQLANNIRHHLKLESLPCTTGKIPLLSAIRQAGVDVSAALRALGYYQGQWQLTHKQKTKNGEPGCWQITVMVEPGEPAILTESDIIIDGDGQDDAIFQDLLPTLPLTKGQQVNHGNYAESKKKLQQRAARFGYFEARFTESVLQVNTNTNTASARLVFDTGKRYHFGTIDFSDVHLSQLLLSRYQTFKPGDPYDAEKLIAFQNHLINSQYFSSVFINQSEPGESSAININVALTLKTTYESIFGAGFSTDIGPRVNYTLKNRHFSDDGKTYELSTLWSPVQQRAGVQLVDPGKDPVKEKTVWSLGWQQEDTDTSKTQSYIAEVSRINMLDNGWNMTRSLTLLTEDYEISDRSDFSTLLYPGISFTRSRSNNPAYPTKGWRLAMGVRGGVEKVVSDTTFGQATADAKGIWPLLGGRIIGRTGLGTTYADNFNSIPASLRFFTGGDNSIRGYDYESLGPKDANDEVVGGKHQVTASVEYDHRVYDDYSAALFFDTGSAFDNSEFTFYESVGFGARWLSPIGPIRLDFAFPLDGGFRLHLSMGPDL